MFIITNYEIPIRKQLSFHWHFGVCEAVIRSFACRKSIWEEDQRNIYFMNLSKLFNNFIFIAFYITKIWKITQIQPYAAMYESKLNSVKHWSIYHVFTACKIKLIIIFDSMFSVCERLGAIRNLNRSHQMWAIAEGIDPRSVWLITIMAILLNIAVSTWFYPSFGSCAFRQLRQYVARQLVRQLV